MATANFILSWARTEREYREVDVAQMRRSLTDIMATGTVNSLAEFQGLLAERLGAMEAAGAGAMFLGNDGSSCTIAGLHPRLSMIRKPMAATARGRDLSPGLPSLGGRLAP